jgi:hypothetical protein
VRAVLATYPDLANYPDKKVCNRDEFVVSFFFFMAVFDLCLKNRTALHRSLSSKSTDGGKDCCRVLVLGGADVNFPDVEGSVLLSSVFAIEGRHF